MKRATPERLRDILEAANTAAQIRPSSRHEFDADLKAQLALTRLVEIIGEAANHVAPTVQQANSDVPWRAIIGMRHRITHGYFEMDLNALWQVLTVDLPEVLPRIEQILAEISAASAGHRADGRCAQEE
ncbi:uncharacterized protein with HEPN domain [Amycolatopsis bartoniae]|uniref:DUF86 domain-containing protein n=1 Tax=Amycolatopsis bartoniae TaxID=941986 RepID=A0A8H9J087_9PSEU|nr:HepT-like ribonuclease domain-containing protein [Amycolatopsis bartoniae]MBB2933254.1 uncharacterized protein with HEPN domain [Amycolatopsis bartoniae]TVT11761.1 DUF86 domain-containing protein [Amycolatopsis bartoniae]GHF58190.1 DUF86 domain-containing protein [Amycolatopsis bartoniae]